MLFFLNILYFYVESFCGIFGICACVCFGKYTLYQLKRCSRYRGREKWMEMVNSGRCMYDTTIQHVLIPVFSFALPPIEFTIFFFDAAYSRFHHTHISKFFLHCNRIIISIMMRVPTSIIVVCITLCCTVTREI